MEPAKQQDFESSEGSDSEPGSEYELEDISEQNLADGEIRPYQFEPEFSEKKMVVWSLFLAIPDPQKIAALTADKKNKKLCTDLDSVFPFFHKKMSQKVI